MDIFTLSNPGYNDGKLINNLKSILWVERYVDVGEFTIVAEATTQLMDDLAIGTLISHPNTLDVMMVETHSIDTSKPGPAEIEITGRSVGGILMENRVTTVKNAAPLYSPWEPQYSGPKLWGGLEHVQGGSYGPGWDPTKNWSEYPIEYMLVEAYPWRQLVVMLEAYLTTFRIDPVFTLIEDGIPNFAVRTTITDPVVEDRSLKVFRVFKDFETVLSAATKICNEHSLGMRIERPSVGQSTLDLVIHRGIDQTATVRFDSTAGDLKNIRYVWSNKNLKTMLYVKQENQSVRIIPEDAGTGWDRRVGVISLDKYIFPTYEEYIAVYPSNWHQEQYATNNIALAMPYATTDLHRSQKNTLLFDFEISGDSRFKYGVDYNIGDIVYVEGDYNANATMRVTEYALSWDFEKGFSGFPTLSVV